VLVGSPTPLPAQVLLTPVCSLDLVHRSSHPTLLSSSLSQVSYVTRVIDPAEYDAAVMGNPSACPLYLAGDLRSGRQVFPYCECKSEIGVAVLFLIADRVGFAHARSPEGPHCGAAFTPHTLL
jgi:hypothetical protein